MPKVPDGPKRPPTAPKSTKLPRNLPDDPIARGVAIMRAATGQAELKPKRPSGRPAKGKAAKA